MKIPPIVIPKEHGAWAMLAIPIMTAVLRTRSASVDFAFFLFATFSIYMSYVPLHTMFRKYTDHHVDHARFLQARFWALAYLALATLFIAPVIVHGYIHIIPIGLLGVTAMAANFFLTLGSPKTIPGDLAAILGLTLSAPAAYYVLRGSFDQNALFLWISNILFFGYSIFYVHMKIKASAAKKPFVSLREKIQVSKYLLLYHFLSMIALLYFILVRFMPPVDLIAFVPIMIQVLLGTIRLSEKVHFKSLGLLLLGHSVLFGVLIGILT
jgi:hypothetical protein